MSKPPKRPPGKALTVSGGNDGKVPALQSTNFLTNFQALTAAFDEQVKLYNELRILWRGRNKPVDLSYEGDDVDAVRELWTSVREGAKRCLATMKALWASRMPDPDIQSPSAEWLAWRIGEMTKAGIKMSADEMEYLADRLEIENIHGMAWESIFREIEDNRSKALTISEMLKFLKETKHITDWKQRLNATDLGNTQSVGEETIVDRGIIQFIGEDTVFAFEFKNSLFEEATLEYLISHDYTDLAAAMRDDECGLRPWDCVIEGFAKTEGLAELVAKMKMQNDYSPNSEFIAKLKAGYRPDLDDPWQQARKILTSNKRVTLEWDLLVKNAQRRLNKDKAFACGCGAGYDEQQDRCKVCGSFSHIVSHAKWEQLIEQNQAELQQQYKIECNLAHKQELLNGLVKPYNADRPGGNDLRSDQSWLREYVFLEKPTLPPKRYIEILHWCSDRGYPYWHTIPEVKGSEEEWIWEDEVEGYDGVYGTADAVLNFGDPLASYYASDEFLSDDKYHLTDSGVHYLISTVYENTDGRKLSLKTIIPYKYEVKQVVHEKSVGCEHIDGKDQVLTEAERQTLDQLLGIEKPTLDDQTQLSELIAKLYAAFLPPSYKISDIRWEVSQRIKQGRPRTPAEQAHFDFAEAKAIERRKAEEEVEARAQAQYEQSPQGRLEAWLSSLSLRYHLVVVENFKYHGIDETVLPHLTHDSLKELGIEWVGDRIKLLDAIANRFPAEQSPVTDGVQ